MKKPATAEDQLKQFRSRWRRWLSQKLRPDRFNWTDLLESNFASWPRAVLGEDYDDSETDVWGRAIDRATSEQLQRLDVINLNFNQDRKRNK